MKAWLSKHLTWQQAKYWLNNGAVTVFGAILLTGIVELGVSAIIANLIRNPITTQVKFVLSRRFVWKPSPHRKIANEWLAFVTVKLISSAVGQLLFIVLVGAFNIDYLHAYAITSLALGLINFKAINKHVFKKSVATLETRPATA